MAVTTPETVTPEQLPDVGAPIAIERAPGRWITHWDPEDEAFWQGGGRAIARRNLIFSILAEHLGFSVWVMWSIVTVNLNNVGFAFTDSQLFWLVAIPSLVGATLRLPYTFAVPRFGGRNWTVVSALLLVIPCAALVWAVSNPGTSFAVMLLVAALAGFGGGNFASSMTNISWFYPEKEKGWALGLNAAGGNIGVAVVQAPFVVAAVVTAGVGIHLERAGLLYIPLALLAAGFAWRYMDNLSVARTDFASSAAVARKPHTWVMSFLYIGTFGSFIGYAAAFPLLIKGQFPDVNVTTYAFLGALVGSLVRPLGGKLSDRVGGARITALSFVAMGVGVLGVVWSLSLHSFGLFFSRVHAALRRDRHRQRLDVPDDPGDLPPRGRRQRRRRGDPSLAARPPQRSASSPPSVPTAGSSCRAPTAGRRRASARSCPRCTSTSACTSSCSPSPGCSTCVPRRRWPRRESE